ncbi:MAG TPA: hypothetical protein VLD65_12700 [Anaerolineales bacterium]|nr:hypothetical protein [Anaerolineales bacterium]
MCPYPPALAPTNLSGILPITTSSGSGPIYQAIRIPAALLEQFLLLSLDLFVIASQASYRNASCRNISIKSLCIMGLAYPKHMIKLPSTFH